MVKLKNFWCACAVFSVSAAALADQLERASDLASKLDPFMAEMEASPLAPPSYSLVIASGNQFLYSRLHGDRILGGGQPVTMDTPFYIASVTKSFVGLLAAKLDADGVLSLDAPLADLWPTLDLPAPIDPASITMRDLLSHTAGLENDPLVVRTAYIGGTDVDAYETILEEHSKAIERSFSYDNLGYLIYSAVLEKQTGRSWKEWLKTDIQAPLGLSTATSSPRAISTDKIALGNHFSPVSKAGWEPARAKADDQMHPAGGLFISTGDAVRWLQANLNQSQFGSSVYGVAHAAYAERSPAKKYADMACSGYGLGWQTCDYSGHRVFYHGGTYDGMMIFMAFLPDDDLVISSINGARAYGWTFGWYSLQQGLDYALGLEKADDNATRRLKGRVESQQGYLRYRVKIREQALRGATTPQAAKLRADLIGSYISPAYGASSICDIDGKLTLTIGKFSAEVVAGFEDKAFVMERAYGEPDKLELSRGEGIGALSFQWEGGTFHKRAGKACVGAEVQSR